MEELWSSGSYEPHLLSLPFAFAPAAILIVIAYTMAMRGSPAMRGWLLLHCVSLMPYAIIMTIAPSTISPEATAQLFRFGAAFIPMAVAAGTGFQFALLKRRSRRDRAIVWIGAASALGWIVIGSVTDAAVTGVHRIGFGLWYANAGPWAGLALLHAVVLSIPGYAVMIRAAIRGKPSRERRQHRIMLAANLVTYAGLVDVGLAYNIGIVPVGWLLSGIGSLVVLRAILVDDLLRVRALDTSAPRLVALFVACVLMSWVVLSLVDHTTWWGTTLILLQCCVGVRVIAAVIALINRGTRGREGPLDRLLAQLVSRARGMTTDTEIATFAAETIELGVGARVDLLLASDADWGWTTMTGERLDDARAPDPLLGSWLVEQHRTVFADDPEREVPADLLPLLEALLVGHGAGAVVPVASADQLLGLVIVPTTASRLRGGELTFLERAAERLAEALVHAGMVERAADRAALAREIQLAQAVQAELLPPRGARAFGRLAVIGSWRPATSCAGDFWGVYPLDDDRTLVAIGDVTGHGIASAMVTAAAVGACDAAARRAGRELDLQDLASALDLAVRRVGGGQLAMTCFASVIDQRANTIRYVSCGHTAPYVLRSGAEKTELQALVGRGNPLGTGAPAVDRYKVLERTLDPGDLVVWYTDGVIDAKDPSGKPFGDRRLQQLLRRLSAGAAIGVHDALHASLAAHRAGQPLADDETVVVAQLAKLGAAPVKLRVLSYNIHKCIGGVDRKYDPTRVVEVIGNLEPDVVMLQEVDAGARRSQGHRQVDLLADELGMKYRTWFANVDVRGGGHYGNAIMSRYPLIESTNIDLTTRFKKKRSVLHGVLRVRHDDIDRTVHVYNMHLGLAGYERKQQIARFLASHPFNGLHAETPVVVGGDLNDVYGGLDGVFAPAGFRGSDRRPRTFPAWGPLRALDAIFVRGQLDFLGLTRCDSDLARRASDHRPLVADIRLRAHHPVRDEATPPTPRP